MDQSDQQVVDLVPAAGLPFYCGGYGEGDGQRDDRGDVQRERRGEVAEADEVRIEPRAEQLCAGGRVAVQVLTLCQAANYIDAFRQALIPKK